MQNNIFETNHQIHHCTGCQICSAVCPTGAIKIKLNDEGFYSPEIETAKCISCGKCKSACYKYDNELVKSNKNEGVWAFAADDELLQQVTSGGAAHLLAEVAIREGYKVIGITYDTKTDTAKAKIATDKIEIEDFKGSKYIQAYTEGIYKVLVSANTDEKFVVFGTPCQIYAINKILTKKGKRDNVILIDLFCHGVPSYFLWQKIISEIKSNKKIDAFDSVNFRSKVTGWHDFCLCFNHQNKKIKKNEFSLFYKLFFDNVVLNNSCYDCVLRSTLEYTDIRLGDFWGDIYDTNTKGVSAIVTVTDKGKDFAEKIKKGNFIQEHKFEDVLPFQSYNTDYKKNDAIRTMLIELLKSHSSSKEILHKYNSMQSVKKMLFFYIKKMTYLLPFKLRCFIKKKFHEKKIRE